MVSAIIELFIFFSHEKAFDFLVICFLNKLDLFSVTRSQNHLIDEFSKASKIRIPRNKCLDSILIVARNKIVVRRSTVASNHQDYLQLNGNTCTAKGKRPKNVSNKSKPFSLTGRLRIPAKNKNNVLLNASRSTPAGKNSQQSTSISNKQNENQLNQTAKDSAHVFSSGNVMVHKYTRDKPHESDNPMNVSSNVLLSAPAGSNNSQSTLVLEKQNENQVNQIASVSAHASTSKAVMAPEQIQHEPHDTLNQMIVSPSSSTACNEPESMLDLIDFGETCQHDEGKSNSKCVTENIQNEEDGNSNNEKSVLNLIGFIGPIQQNRNVLNVMDCIPLSNNNVQNFQNNKIESASSITVQKTEKAAPRLLSISRKPKKYHSIAAMLVDQRADSVDLIVGPSSSAATTLNDPKISTKSDFGMLNYEGMNYSEESD